MQRRVALVVSERGQLTTSHPCIAASSRSLFILELACFSMVQQTSSMFILLQRTAGAPEIFCRQISHARGQIPARTASDAKSSPLFRGVHFAARSSVQPRDWSDVNGSGRGTTGTVG